MRYRDTDGLTVVVVVVIKLSSNLTILQKNIVYNNLPSTWIKACRLTLGRNWQNTHLSELVTTNSVTC